MDKSQERRKHPRGDISWPVSIIADSGPVDGITLNITPGGLSIACDEPLRLDENYTLSIMPPNQQIIKVVAKVVWSDLYGIDEQNSTVCMGVCFVEISNADRDFFKTAVTNHLQRGDQKAE